MTGATVTDLWNEKNRLGAQIEQLVKPFLAKYNLAPDDVEIRCDHHGCVVRVTI